MKKTDDGQPEDCAQKDTKKDAEEDVKWAVECVSVLGFTTPLSAV